MGSYPPIVIHRVKAALATYAWSQTHIILKFAHYCGHSEFAVRSALAQLVADGQAKRVRVGLTNRGQPRVIYQLTQSEHLRMIPCQVAAQPMGWLVTFPANPQAGLVLFSDSEKVDFVTSCQLDLAGEDPLLVDLAEIERCPDYWYHKARQFPPPF
jgi:hypothetical protein